MKRAVWFAAGMGFGFWAGLGLAAVLEHSGLLGDQTRPEYQPAWEKRATA